MNKENLTQEYYWDSYDNNHVNNPAGLKVEIE